MHRPVSKQDILLSECQALLILISRRPDALKLLNLIELYLAMLVKSK